MLLYPRRAKTKPNRQQLRVAQVDIERMVVFQRRKVDDGDILFSFKEISFIFIHFIVSFHFHSTRNSVHSNLRECSSFLQVTGFAWKPTSHPVSQQGSPVRGPGDTGN